MQRGDTLLAFNFSDREQTIELSGSWTMVIDSGAALGDHIAAQAGDLRIRCVIA